MGVGCRGTGFNQGKPLAGDVFISANENPTQDPITVSHKCLIHREENKFDLNRKNSFAKHNSLQTFTDKFIVSKSEFS